MSAFAPSSKRSLLYTSLLSTALIAVKPVLAQDNTDKSSATGDDKQTSTQQTSNQASSQAASTTSESKASTTEKASSTTEEKNTSTEEEKSSTTSSSSKTSTTSTTTSKTTSTSTSEGNIRITASLTGKYGVPTYAPAAVPPTVNAPFMQHSRAPEGTVFIAVGAILGAFFLAILLWRVIVGLLLHRSVERAAKAQHDTNAKTGFPAPPAPFYKYTDQNSTMSLSQPGRNPRRTTRGTVPSMTNASASNLFFSPTAANSTTPGNRASTYLPSGFYAAGAGSNNNQTQRHSTSMTNLRPISRGDGSRNTFQGTPPDSPQVVGTARRDLSATSLNLNRPHSQRAPSAYLDDLLADDPNAFPPSQMPSTSSRHSAHLGGQQYR
ncbi:unnamed protein product [Clonostachys rosea]|uniref:Mid2 domain-containing protein n=1 Tax=Bionectria ochroleuca TaxID=29856 RepID=A0ABY6TR81_BIOOC|nr:unnamed protein product [Clonostachys rosea]